MKKEGLNQLPINQVQLICGVLDGEIPTAPAILKKDREKYGHLAPLAYNAGFKSTKRPGENLPTFMQGCATPAFFVRHGGYFYSLDKEKEINAFFEAKKRKR